MPFYTKLKYRMALLGAALINLFTGKEFRYQRNVEIRLLNDKLKVTANVSLGEEVHWSQVEIDFDYKNPPIAHINGVLIASPNSGISIQAGGNVTIDSLKVNK